jgi:hypothetical protein
MDPTGKRQLHWSRRFRKTPDRGLADIFSDWILDMMSSNYKSSLELMLTISLLLGLLAFWELAPQRLLEVEPTLIFNPEKLNLLKSVILHRGCEPLNIDEGHICTCTQDPFSNIVAEAFQHKSLQTTEGMRSQGRSAALAMTVTSILIGLMLNTVATSHIMG